jgi:hypothetical protein
MKALLGSVQVGLTSLLAGGACACVALFLVEYVVIPVDLNGRKWHAKENERWTALLEWISQYGLPIALMLGAIAGRLLQRYRPFRLGVVGLAGCTFAIAFFALALRPRLVARWPPAPLPLPEAVPDAIATTFGWLGLAIVVMGVIWHISGQYLSGGPGMIWRVLHKCGAFIMCAGVFMIMSEGIARSGLGTDNTWILLRPVHWFGVGAVCVGMILAVVAAFGGHAEPGVGADSR